ncbi:hypothetical protein [Endozoicomonas sp. ALC020]|uniref:hypothetical protein n=1 Tax=unclassified Endozoicomonas TaxID=2644528 RepID=UPI003BAE483B
MRRWTKKEEQYLEANYKKYPLDETACALGRTRNSVFSKALYMGITGQVTGEEHKWSRHSDHDIALARALAEENVPVATISEKLCIPRRTLYYYLNNPDKRPTRALA